MNQFASIIDQVQADGADPGPDKRQSLMERVAALLRGISRLFIAMVIVPTLASIIYFGFLASDIYVSEARIVVRSPGEANISPIGAVLSGSNIAGANEESEAVMEFLSSRQSLSEVNADGLVTRAWSNPEIFFFDRFGWSGRSTNEHLFEFYLDKVQAEKSTRTSIMVLRVQSFDPVTAQTINRRLLEQSETLVNDLSERARQDAIEFASQQVDQARAASKQAQIELARYQDERGIINPELQATAGLQFISKLQDELISSRTQLLQMETYTPQASQIPFLRTRIRRLEQEIAEQTALLAGGTASLSAASARYQELVLASEFSEKQLAMALGAFQEAQAEAVRKQAYVDRVSNPSLPDYPEFPRRLRNIVATLVLGLLAWGLVSMLLVGVREHRN
jgi:capsular polysaccharide transport system permease protein